MNAGLFYGLCAGTGFYFGAILVMIISGKGFSDKAWGLPLCAILMLLAFMAGGYYFYD